MENLFDYQAQAVEAIVSKKGRCILHADAGVGKTAIAVKYAANYALGHTLFLCPTICKKQVENEVGRFTEAKSIIVDGNANSRQFAWESVFSSKEKLIVIVNYESLVADIDILQKLTKQGLMFDCIIVDECFTYDTPVMTERGLMRIGDIVENRLNIKVLSCDLSSNELQWKSVVHWMKKERKNELVEIKYHLEDGTLGSLICTSNHKIFIHNKNKYAKAEDIAAIDGAELRIMQDGLCTKERVQKNTTTKVLFSKMFGNFFGRASTQANSFIKRAKSKDVRKNERELSKKPITQSRVIREDEDEKPNDKRRYTREDETEGYWKSIQNTWRKWAYNRTTKEAVRVAYDSAQTRTCCKNKTDVALCRKNPSSLQNRFSNTGVYDSNRGRWSWASFTKEKAAGCEKEQGFRIARVDSVEVLEQRNRRGYQGGFAQDQFVYNIEVKDNHNYFADKVLVSNCQKGANPQNKFVKIIKKLWNARLRVAMSGTPITNELHEYWSMVDWCEPGILGKSFYQFKTDWCIMSPYIPGKIMGYRKENLLREVFSEFIIRIKREDVLLDLPELRELEDKGKLNFNEQLTYDKLKKDLVLEISNSETITVSSVLASIIKLRQLVDCPQSLGFDFIGSKLHRAKTLLDAWLEEDKENKIIVFSELKPPLLFLAEKYENSGLITGDVSQKNREEVLENFRTRPECRILFCSSAGATGVNMQSANKILNYGLPWTYSKLEQRTARAWRQGQERPVESRLLIAEDTIDEHMLRLVRRKEKLTKNDLLDILEA
jgi:hypothetical protein